MRNRDLLLEFVQWLADNLGPRQVLFGALDDDDPISAEVVIDEFLESVGES